MSKRSYSELRLCIVDGDDARSSKFGSAAVPYRILTGVVCSSPSEYVYCCTLVRANQANYSRYYLASWPWHKKWSVRLVLGPFETDFCSRSWISLGIRPVSDANCAENCSTRNAFIGKAKCIAKTTFIGKQAMPNCNRKNSICISVVVLCVLLISIMTPLNSPVQWAWIP